MHDRDIGADETKGPAIDLESKAICLDKTGTTAMWLRAPTQADEQNRRAHDQSGRGEKQLFPAHENRRPEVETIDADSSSAQNP